MANEYMKDPLEMNKKNWKTFWEQLSPQKKRLVALCSIGVLIFCLVMVVVSKKKAAQEEMEQKKANSKVSTTETVKFDNKLIQESLLEAVERKSNQRDKEVQDLRKLIADQSAKFAEAQKELSEMQATTPGPAATVDSATDNAAPDGEKPPVVVGKRENQKPSYPQPPAPNDAIFINQGTPQQGGRNQGGQMPTELQTQMIGGIDGAHQAVQKKTDGKEDTQKKKNIIHLPPSFMEATTLTGLTAQTIGQKDKPMPIIMRIKDLAILPNYVKANLKGCYVFAEGVGDLSTQRIDTRPTTLACVAKNGTAVIEESVEGWIEDEDGQVGLSAIARADMGTHMARAFIVGALGGVGDAMSDMQSTETTSVLGTTTSIYTDEDAKSIAKAGIGKGVSNSAKELAKLYIKLAEATMPVLQAGAEKNVTVVIKKGVDLEIKNVTNYSSKGE